MAGKFDRHLDEETAERYSLGSLSARAAAEIEEHLLTCQSCRQTVAASDTYSAAMRQASARLRRAAQKPKRKVIRKAGE